MIEGVQDAAKLNPEERKAYQGAIKELVSSMVRVEAETELQKEIAKQQKDKYGIDAADTKKAAKIIFRQSLEEERAKSEEFFDFVEANLDPLLKKG